MRRLGPDFQTLELAAQQAGSALACDFASSAEFEAATIAAKRAAGIYGPKRHRRHALLIGGAIAVLVLTAAVLS
jgi:hypothetical protein